MMRIRFLALLVLAAAPLPVAAAGITYDCDTPSGHFSELVLPAPAGPFRIEGNVAVREVAEIGKWLPVARLVITDAPSAPGQSSDSYGGFALTVLPADKIKRGAGKGLIQFLRWDEGGVPGEQQQPFAIGPAKTDIAFVLSFDGRAATVELGGERKTIAVTARDPAVRIICSTGDFLFTNLRITPQN